ncbi:ABC transporter C family member 10-like [Papaver somniferum]|uniref:ABC transporter C family member 10-like n=1 Tax=Papaver somniferum TaxID=3469 RepID=UPI000E6F7883|nr:ABC transporter C family member 10-like [Papaver somniferum]
MNNNNNIEARNLEKEINTPFANAGLLSRISFWWLNPLMKKAKKKMKLEDDDIPMLRNDDRAETCYLLFMEKFKTQKQTSEPSILRATALCYWKEILVSGFFALLKVLTLSTAPLFVGAFIKVTEGKGTFKHEGIVLVIALFLIKLLESLSMRQWYFLSGLMGVRLRSLLSAAIYRKQLRLSNAAKNTHSAGEIINYVTVDAYRVGEFSYMLHQTWTTVLQTCLGLLIFFHAVGIATLAAMIILIFTVLCNGPLAKVQLGFQTKLAVAQDRRLKAMSEALLNMKVVKLYAWETHFMTVIKRLRRVEYKWLSAVQLRKAYEGFCFCATNVFTFVATLRTMQNSIKSIPQVIDAVIHAKVSLQRIANFLAEPELLREEIRHARKENPQNNLTIHVKLATFSWEENPSKPTLTSINLEVKPGEKVAICGEVGSGKSTLLAAILGEVPEVEGSIQVHGRLTYVSQTAWIQSGSIQQNILFGRTMDELKYQETLEKCSLVKDLEMLPYGDLTEIGERGINLSGGQKQRIQLARALYQDADIYLLDDPFSAVDALTATSLFNEYVMGALSEKTVLLVAHQVDLLPSFDSVLLMSHGKIQHAASFDVLMSSSQEFFDLVNAHKNIVTSDRLPAKVNSRQTCVPLAKKTVEPIAVQNQFIKQEERESGISYLKPYLLYLNQGKGFFFFSLATVAQLLFLVSQILQNSWMAANVQNPRISKLRLIEVYLLIGFISIFWLLVRSLSTAALGINSSKSLFSKLLKSLIHAPVAFYESTPLGRILSRVSSDSSIVDLDVPFSLVLAIANILNTYASLGVMTVITWQVLFVTIPMVCLVIYLQRYYSASANELMRINGTTKSLVANQLGESIAGAMTIRAFDAEDRFFAESLHLIDKYASPSFHIFSTNQWLLQRLETLSATVLSFSALVMVLLPQGTFSSGFIGMALSYGLSLSLNLCSSVQHQCTIANDIISVERLNQYVNIPSEASQVIKGNRPKPNWPTEGRVEIHDLKIRYRANSPLVLQGVTCTFEGGHKVGIVGRTGSGKTTLISALFRLVEPVEGKIIIDDVDISTIGLHDLRSRLGIIPQEPTLFSGTVRYNLDPLDQYTDHEIWEVVGKCQLIAAVQNKDEGLDSLVAQDGANWSLGQRQLFCLGRALLRKSQILVLDEATASIDNATDCILQKIIRTEFAKCTVITVAHRIPTVMDSTLVLAISDGKIVEYDEPMKLMKEEGSLFGQLVSEYWSHSHSV